MSEAIKLTVEQLLLQQNLRDKEIAFLKSMNQKLNVELQLSRSTIQKLNEGLNILRWKSSVVMN